MRSAGARRKIDEFGTELVQVFRELDLPDNVSSKKKSAIELDGQRVLRRAFWGMKM